MREMISGRGMALCAMLAMAPILGCGSRETSSTASQKAAAPTDGGERIIDEGAPGEAGGAPQDPAGQDAPSPKAPAPVED
jgi:hypothetical protein